MDFSKAINNESKKTYTENGALALNTTGSSLLDLFGTIGSLREADSGRIQRLYADAYKEDKLLATKILFYSRDIRGGLGERKVFRELLHYAAKYHPETIVRNIPLIPFYGRFDDLYMLIGTSLETEMWNYMKIIFNMDLKLMEEGKPCSLLAKWMKSSKTTVKATRALGLLTATKLGMLEKEYKRKLHALREYLKVVETKMCANEWSDIQYSQLPSRAIRKYAKAFQRHDEERYTIWLDSLTRGEVKVNASTLYPYDIVEQIISIDAWGSYSGIKQNDLAEAQWKALPNYVKEGSNVIVVADLSGSMFWAHSGGKKGRPAMTAIGLAIYFAERNVGPYKDIFMSFSSKSDIQVLKGETLYQKISNLNYRNWDNSTNLHGALEKILDIAIKNKVSNDEMVKSIIIISDMEIDEASRGNNNIFYDNIEEMYRVHGYTVPNIVFWNVDSRNDIFHADKNRKGVQLCSGQSPTVFKQLLNCIGKTPIEMMYETLNSDRYSSIVIDE